MTGRTVDTAAREPALKHPGVPMPAEIRAFFENYRDAFNALSGPQIAQLYAEPSAMAQDGQLTVWQTRADVSANMSALCSMYSARGYAGATFEPKAFLDQGETYAVADIAWHIDWRDESTWRFRTTYNLVRTAQGWRILLCTAYQEDKLHRP